VETWKFTKNKLLKPVNPMKPDYFLLAGINKNRIIQKKKCQNKDHFMDDALEIRGLYI